MKNKNYLENDIIKENIIMQSISYINLADSVDFKGSELSFRNARLQRINDASSDVVDENIISRFYNSFKDYFKSINFTVFTMVLIFSIGIFHSK